MKIREHLAKTWEDVGKCGKYRKIMDQIIGTYGKSIGHPL